MFKKDLLTKCPRLDYAKLYIIVTAIILFGLYKDLFKKYNLVVFLVAVGLLILVSGIKFDMEVDLMQMEGPKCPTNLILDEIKNKNKKNEKKEEFKVEVWNHNA